MMSPTSISSPVGGQAEKESLTEITHMEEFAMSDQFENTERSSPFEPRRLWPAPTCCERLQGTGRQEVQRHGEDQIDHQDEHPNEPCRASAVGYQRHGH